MSPWRLQVFPALPSTSTLCRQLAEAGEPEGLAVLAHRQTEGRGTQGRMWVSPPGNLSLSLLLRPGGPARHAGLWGLMAAVATAEAVATLLTDPPALRLKWPNDIMLHGAKLAGVLTEASVEGETLAWLVMGIGVNLRTAPDVAGRETAAIGPAAPAPDALTPVLLGRVAEWRRRVAVEGFAPLRAAWLARGPALGAHLTLHQAGGVRAGSFAGLGEDGTLLLATGGRVHAFAAGET